MLDKITNTAIAEESDILDDIGSYTELSDYYRSFLRYSVDPGETREVDIDSATATQDNLSVFGGNDETELSSHDFEKSGNTMPINVVNSEHDNEIPEAAVAQENVALNDSDSDSSLDSYYKRKRPRTGSESSFGTDNGADKKPKAK